MVVRSKAQCRQEVLAARRAVPAAVRAAEARQLLEHLPVAAAGAQTVCAYLPVGAEPGSPQLLDRLRELGAVVLLPVTRTGAAGEHLPLLWGRYAPDRLEAGRFGLQEPQPPWLPSDAITGADLVLVPALAVDRRGVRLGRGGGFYDRSLSLCRPDARLVAVVRDDELVDELPDEPHDVRCTHALTPAGGLIALGGE